MAENRQINRQQFLKLSMTLTGVWFGGCSDGGDEAGDVNDASADTPTAPGTGGSGSTGGVATSPAGGGRNTGGAGADDASGGVSNAGASGGAHACTAGVGGNFGITHTAATNNVTHSHLTGPGNTLATALELVLQINAGTPLYFRLPTDVDHSHVVSFTSEEYTALRNGGSVSKTTGLDDSSHRHTYLIECMP